MLKLFFLLFITFFAPLAYAAPQTYCGGKYKHAAELVDNALRKYSTLYSGGNHWQQLDDVGATLDLYRFWNDAPDIALRDFRAPYSSEKDLPQFYFTPDGYKYGGVTAKDIWNNAQAGLSLKTKTVTREQLIWAAWGMDTLTSLGPSPDWWHKPDSHTSLTKTQKWVAEISKNNEVVDWLQTVLTASDAPWAIYGHLADREYYDQDKGYHRLALASMARYEAGDGIEWLVASMLNDTWGLKSGYIMPVRELVNKIKTCAASPQEYAAIAFIENTNSQLWVTQDKLFGHMPESVQKASVKNAFYRNYIRTHGLEVFYRSDRDVNAADWIHRYRDFAPNDLEWQGVLDVAQLYFARNLAEIPLSANRYVRRAYNFLSADDIYKLARRKGWSRIYKNQLRRRGGEVPVIANMEVSLIITAFSRYVSLGAWDKAENILPDLKTVMPEFIERMDELWNLPEPKDIRLSLIALHTRGLTTIISGGGSTRDIGLIYNGNYVSGHRNVPRHYANGQPLRRDFETWMFMRKRWGSFFGMRGASIEWIERASRRKGSGAHLKKTKRSNANLPEFFADTYRRGVRFEKLIAWDEVARLSSGDERFMYKLAGVLIPWAEQNTSSRWQQKGSNKVESDALARLVFLCKYNACGENNGIPAQERAFRLLKYRMPKTEAAKRTHSWRVNKYW